MGFHSDNLPCDRQLRQLRLQAQLSDGLITPAEFDTHMLSLNSLPSGGALDEPVTVDDYHRLTYKHYITGTLEHMSLINPTSLGDCLFTAVQISRNIFTLPTDELHRFIEQSLGGRKPALEPYQTGCRLHSDALFLRRSAIRHLRYLHETKLHSVINELLADFSDADLDLYLATMHEPDTPAGILEVATLADMLKIPIEVLRENEEHPTSLTSFGLYLPLDGEPISFTSKTRTMQLILENDHFSPIIRQDSCLWPDRPPTSIPPTFQTLRQSLARRAEHTAHTYGGISTLGANGPKTTWLRGPSLPPDTTPPFSNPAGNIKDQLISDLDRTYNLKQRPSALPPQRFQSSRHRRRWPLTKPPPLC